MKADHILNAITTTLAILVSPVAGGTWFFHSTCDAPEQAWIDSQLKRATTISSRLPRQYFASGEYTATAKQFVDLFLAGNKQSATDLFNAIATYTGRTSPIQVWNQPSEDDMIISCDYTSVFRPINGPVHYPMVKDTVNNVDYSAPPNDPCQEGTEGANVLWHYATGKPNHVTFCPWYLAANTNGDSISSVEALIVPTLKEIEYKRWWTDKRKFKEWYNWWKSQRPSTSNNRNADMDAYQPSDIQLINVLAHTSIAGFKGAPRTHQYDSQSRNSWALAKRFGGRIHDATRESITFMYLALALFADYQGYTLDESGKIIGLNAPTQAQKDQSQILDLGSPNGRYVKAPPGYDPPPPYVGDGLSERDPESQAAAPVLKRAKEWNSTILQTAEKR